MGVLILTVTQDDIDRGIRGDGLQCAVAHALRRFSAEHSKRAGRWVGNLRMDRLPADLRQFIADFDAGRPVQPGTFTLDEGMFTLEPVWPRGYPAGVAV